MDNPRGRIDLMRAAAEGRIGLDGAFRQHIELCLACRACESACPSGVRYGALVEVARAAIEASRTPGLGERFLRWLLLRQMLPHPRRLRRAAALLRLYQRLGVPRLVQRTPLLPARLRAMEALLPPLPPAHSDVRVAAPAGDPPRGRVAFFHGCVQDAFFADVNAATLRVLQRNGYAVHVPPGQTCCGAAPLHLGERELARELARRNVDAFLAGDYEAIINNAGGCGAALKEYPHLLEDDPAYATKARRFAAQVQDISEFLAQNLHVPPQGEVHVRATYVDSCHLRHAQKVVHPPRELLRAIPGLELVELARPDWCCGSAGVYNILQRETADAVLEAKMADIAATGAELIVTTNTGCHLQLLYGVRRAGLKAQVVHLVELLERSYARVQQVTG
jgi:glycolate oxidase iron-sulfur subunit